MEKINFRFLNYSMKLKHDVSVKLSHFHPDKFIEHGNVEELEKLYKQDAEFIYSKVDTLLN